MARIRSVKPEFWTSEQVVECSPTARLLFIGLWNFCDDSGVHPASPKRLKMEVFPADEINVATLVEELLTHRLIECYTVHDESFWIIPSFSKHQRPDKPSYKYPLQDGNLPNSERSRRVNVEHSNTSRGVVADQSSNGSSVVAMGIGKERKGVGVGVGDWTDDDVGINVCKALKFSGIRHPQWISRACPYIRERMNLKTNQEVMDWLPAAWKRYESSEAEYKYGFEKWLGEGHWADDQPQPGRTGSGMPRLADIVREQREAEALDQERKRKAVAAK